MIVEVDENLNNNNKKKQQTSKKVRLPPIVMQRKPTSGKYSQLIKLINEDVLDQKYKIKYTNNTNIYVETDKDHESLIKILIEKGMQFHTYIWKDQRTHVFVLCDLHH